MFRHAATCSFDQIETPVACKAAADLGENWVFVTQARDFTGVWQKLQLKQHFEAQADVR